MCSKKKLLLKPLILNFYSNVIQVTVFFIWLKHNYLNHIITYTTNSQLTIPMPSHFISDGLLLNIWYSKYANNITPHRRHTSLRVLWRQKPQITHLFPYILWSLSTIDFGQCAKCRQTNHHYYLFSNPITCECKLLYMCIRHDLQ